MGDVALLLEKLLRFARPRNDLGRLVFSANSGRVGSRYLAELVDTAREARACHEPEPKMIDGFVRLINEHEYAFSYDRRRLKCEAVAKALAAVPGPNMIYCETSHMFIKTFQDVILDTFPETRVIILRRPLVQTLKSFVELGYFSEANQAWPKWMASPNAVTAALPAIVPDRDLGQIDACIAYLFDTEARIQRMLDHYPKLETIEVHLESLSSHHGVKQLFDWLGVTASADTAKLLGKKVNAKDRNKAKLNRSITIEECQRRIEAYVERARRAWSDNPKSDMLDRVLVALPH